MRWDTSKIRLCTVPDCGRKHYIKGYCIMHHARWKAHGDPLIVKTSFRSARTPTAAGYLRIRDTIAKTARYEHIILAEKALGKSLPKGAHVHHIDGNRKNNNPKNLVICPDAVYHNLIEYRTKAYIACGKAGYFQCWICKRWDDPKVKSKDRYVHIDCWRKYSKKKRMERKNRL